MTPGPSRSTADVVHVRDGGDDAPGVVLRTNPAQLDDLVTDQVTVVGMQTNGTLDQPVGRFDALLDWWLLLRGALDARAPHVPGAIALVDADGAPLALDRSFPADAPLDEMGDFLQRAGYLHIEGVFTEDEMAAVSLDMDRAAPMYTPERRTLVVGDGTVRATSCWCACSTSTRCHPQSSAWWTTSACCASPTSPVTVYVFGSMDDNRIEALFKPFDVVDGDLRPARGTRTARSAATATTAAG